YSWSTNVAGVKLWVMFPVEFARRRLQKSSRSVNTDAFSVFFPELLRKEGFAELDRLVERWLDCVLEGKEAESDDADGSMYVFLQKPGDAIFVPSFWAHEVHNVTS